MPSRRLTLCTLVVLVTVWARFAVAEPRPVRRDAAFKASLSTERWQSRNRFRPLRGTGGPQLAGPRLNIHSVGQVIMVRSTAPAERGGVQGELVRDFVRLRPAGTATPSQVSSRQAYDRTATLTEQTFALGPVTAAGLQRAAIRGVLGSGCTDSRGAYRAAMRGLTGSLGDMYSRYFEPSDWAGQLQRRAGTGKGLGIQMVDGTGEGVQISKVVPGSPAEGLLRAGDQLLDVGGQRVRSSTDVQQTLSRFLDQRISLTVRRAGQLKVLTVQPREYRERLVFSDLAAPGIGVVRLVRFAAGTADGVRQAIEELGRRSGGLKGLVLDLRGNGGGLTAEAHGILNLFIPGGDLFYFSRRETVLERHSADPGRAPFAQLPLTVLVDGESASSSEIVAGALKTRGRAPLVGSRTFGKGIAQTLHDLPDGGGLNLTTMRIGLASDRPERTMYYHGAGLTPDVEVPAAARGGDAALRRAVDLLRSDRP